MKFLITSILMVLLTFSSFNLIRAEDLPFSQEIRLPIDTSLPEAKLQPIDIKVEFKHPCWARDEKNNSVRVFCEGDFGVKEIESQIYDLEFSDENHISSCRLVFLIPEYANGEERYIIKYSDSKVEPANYEDHVDVEDTHYYYEPIPGQKIDFDYFKIIEDDKYIVYGVMQAGVLLGTKTCHTIIKLKPNSTEFETVNADQFASFAFRYKYNGRDTGTDSSKEVEKSILIDGNLMVRVRIKSISPDGKVETDNIYTYYYSPKPTTKRMIVKVNHKILDTIDGIDKEKDGIYASISTFKSRSSSIKNMNVGNILPYFYFYDDNGLIQTVDVPENPDTKDVDWIISTRDDKDLGEKAWIAMGNSQGKMHAILFNSNRNISNEEDGLQVKLGVKEHVKMPGLEADSCNVYVNRDSYDKGKDQDLTIEKGTNISFEAEFITFERGKVDDLSEEADIYQALSKLRRIEIKGIKSEKSIERYNLTVDVHLAPSFPLGTLLSAATGKNFSYIYVEVYKGDNLVSSGTASRLPLSGEIPSFNNKSLVEKVKLAISIFDWKNASFFKSLVIPDLEEGKYLVKVYKENSIFGKKKFIGFRSVNLDSDKRLGIFCTPEIKLVVSLKDQDGNYVENADVILKYKDEIIQNLKTSGKEEIIGFPYKRGRYTLDIIYQGFLVYRESIQPRILDIVRGIKLERKINLYDLTLRVKDVLGLDFGAKLYPTLSSDEMVYKTTIGAKKINNIYKFERLYPASYILRIEYRTFSFEKKIEIDSDKEIEVELPAFHKLRLMLRDYQGLHIDKAELSLTREGRKLEFDIVNGEASIDIPPGSYFALIRSGKRTIAKLSLHVYGDKDMILLTSEESLHHRIIFYLGMILLMISALVLIFRKDFSIFLSLLSISLIVLSIYFPWWLLDGKSVDISTKITLYPPLITSFISTTSTYGGEINLVPEIINQILLLILYILIANAVVILISAFLKSKKRKALLIISIIISALSLILFFYSISQLTKIGVGSFQGHGRLDVSVLGEQIRNVDCSWGPHLGFLMILLTIPILTSTLLLEIKRFKVKKNQD